MQTMKVALVKPSMHQINTGCRVRIFMGGVETGAQVRCRDIWNGDPGSIIGGGSRGDWCRSWSYWRRYRGRPHLLLNSRCLSRQRSSALR